MPILSAQQVTACTPNTLHCGKTRIPIYEHFSNLVLQVALEDAWAPSLSSPTLTSNSSDTPLRMTGREY